VNAAHEDRPGPHQSTSHGAICVTIDRAINMLGIGRTKLYELIAAGELETIHIGRRTLVLQESIDALIRRLRQGSGAQGQVR